MSFSENIAHKYKLLRISIIILVGEIIDRLYTFTYIWYKVIHIKLLQKWFDLLQFMGDILKQ